MVENEFGAFLKGRRAALRLSLRGFAQRAGLDPGNASRLERGRAAPPESAEVLDRIVAALELRKGSRDHHRLLDLAAAARGRIPEDLLSDDAVAARLPVLFRTLRSKPLTAEQLDRLIDAVRKA